MLSKEQCREIIARRVAKEFAEGDVITLGIGLPTEVANYIPHNMHVIFQSETACSGSARMTAPPATTRKLPMPAESR